MNKELQKIYEIMSKLSPEFKLTEGPSFNTSFGDTFNTPDLQNTNSDTITTTTTLNKPTQTNSIVNDNQLNVGELKYFIDLLSKSKSKEELMAKSKEAGADILKLAVGFIPIVGNVVGTGIDVAGVFKKLFKPKTGPEAKSPNEFMQLLSIDSEVSILLDDKIEYDFIEYAINSLNKMPDNSPVPDFFEELKKYIKDKYSKIYNLTKL